MFLYAKTQCFKDVNSIIPQINPINLVQHKKSIRIFHRMLKVRYMIKVFQINGEKIIDCLINDVGMVAIHLKQSNLDAPSHKKENSRQIINHKSMKRMKNTFIMEVQKAFFKK